MNLAVSDDGVEVKASASSIAPLVALLGAQSSAVVQEKAAKTLRSLAANPENKVKIVAAGAISPLVALLGPQSSAGVQEQAAGALCSLCLLYTSPSPRDRTRSRMPSSA